MVKTGVTPEINAISSVLLLATILMVFLSERLARDRASRLAMASGAAALLLLVVFAFGGESARAKGGELNVFIWSNYLPDEVIAEFERRFEAKVNIELYDSNEAMLARLQAGGASYDIIVPSDYMVTVLREQGLLEEIDRDRLTNFSNLDPQFVGLEHDAENRFSVPYLWGTTGIGYRKDKIDGPVDSWSIMWDARYRDRITMLDDVREAMGAALKREGKSLNTTDESEIAEAARLLAEQKPLVKAYDSGGFDQLLLAGDAWIVQGYSGQIAKAMAEDANIGYAIPKEGCTLAVDNLCVPKGATHRELAIEFINFILEARIAAEISNGTGYATANLAARAYIKPELLNNEAAYPSKELLGGCESIKELGEAISVYDRFWTEIKSR
jgi:spermidine/putrescine-binding protein